MSYRVKIVSRLASLPVHQSTGHPVLQSTSQYIKQYATTFLLSTCNLQPLTQNLSSITNHSLLYSIRYRIYANNILASDSWLLLLSSRYTRYEFNGIFLLQTDIILLFHRDKYLLYVWQYQSGTPLYPHPLNQVIANPFCNHC